MLFLRLAVYLLLFVAQLANVAAEEQAAMPSSKPVSASGLEPVRTASLTSVFTTLGELPNEYRPANTTADFRDPYLGSPSVHHVRWVADNLFHRTLYFEDLPLERHGLSRSLSLQPTISWFRFVGDAVVLPLRMLWTPPRKCNFVQCDGHAGSPTR